MVGRVRQAQSADLRLFTLGEEEGVAFLALRLEQGDLVEGVTDRIARMVEREPQIRVVVVGAQGI
jgi:hypothetical protein